MKTNIVQEKLKSMQPEVKKAVSDRLKKATDNAVECILQFLEFTITVEETSYLDHFPSAEEYFKEIQQKLIDEMCTGIVDQKSSVTSIVMFKHLFIFAQRNARGLEQLKEMYPSLDFTWVRKLLNTIEEIKALVSELISES